MLFCTTEYLFFFIVVVGGFFLIPQKLKRYWLLAASLFFYACWKVEYLTLIILSVLVTFYSAIVIDRLRQRGKGKRSTAAVLAACLVANLSILFVFKYFNFCASVINALLGRQAIGYLDVILPVGISFYTFQAIGYTIDVYRGTVEAEKSVSAYALFVCFFPQLVAGPIERTGHLLPQLKAKFSFDYERMKRGLILIGWGVFTKLVIADRLAPFVESVYSGYEEAGGARLMTATLLFTVQIYCDFMSYSNIARGTAEVMGIRLMKNFNTPYFSETISEYWSRWHISLSTWLNDYIFLPLSLNFKRKNIACGVAISLIVTFLISGAWHGAAWTYILWGMIHGAYSVTGNATRKIRRNFRKKIGINDKSRLYRIWKKSWVFILVNVANIFFRAESVDSALAIVRSIFSMKACSSQAGIFSLGLDRPDAVVAAVAVAVLWAVDLIGVKRDVRDELMAKPVAIQWAVYLLLIASIVVFGIYGPEYDATPFIYFQF